MVVFVSLSINTASAETKSMRAGARTTAFVASGADATSNDEDMELLQKELYWGMKEMKRYNALRGSWPVRDGAKERDGMAADNSEGCA